MVWFMFKKLESIIVKKLLFASQKFLQGLPEFRRR